MLLEVSAEKPGNVNLTSSFEKTTCQHFLASAIATGPSFQEAAERGTLIADKKLRIEDAGLGELIKTCAKEVNSWQRGGNTVLGTIMLFVPIAVAAGIAAKDNGRDLILSELRKNIDLVVKSTSAQDSVNIYDAIKIANPSGLGKTNDLDVNDPDSKGRLIRENITLFEVFKLGALNDDICSEWVNNYPITFDLAYPYLSERLKRQPVNNAVVHTFLKILSDHPDTFIARKVGKEIAGLVSNDAKAVLELGGLETVKGRASLRQLDRKLRSTQNKCNPGTTADLTAAALALCTLTGYRP